MKATRRAVLAGALAAPAVAAVPAMAWARGGKTVLVHDPALHAGRRLASVHDGEVLAIAGDRIRFARELFSRRASLVIGVTRSADALLIDDVGREAGYVAVDDDKVREMTAASQALDRGLVLGWALIPRA